MRHLDADDVLELREARLEALRRAVVREGDRQAVRPLLVVSELGDPTAEQLMPSIHHE